MNHHDVHFTHSETIESYNWLDEVALIISKLYVHIRFETSMEKLNARQEVTYITT